MIVLSGGPTDKPVRSLWQIHGATVVALRLSWFLGEGGVWKEVQLLRSAGDEPRTKLAVHLDWATVETLGAGIVLELRPDYFVIDTRDVDFRRLVRWLRTTSARERMNTGRVIATGISLDYDEDPCWTVERLRDVARELPGALFVLTAMPGLEYPVPWFLDEAGKYDEDVLGSDIEEVLRAFPALLNMSFRANDVPFVCRTFPSAVGYYFEVWNAPPCGWTPVPTDVEEVTGVLESLRGRPDVL